MPAQSRCAALQTQDPPAPEHVLPPPQSAVEQYVPFGMQAPPHEVYPALHDAEQEPPGPEQDAVPFAGAPQSAAVQQLVVAMQAAPQILPPELLA